MEKFISKGKSFYDIKENVEKKSVVSPGTFIPKSNVTSSQILKNNTTNITGRKVTFKHV